MRNLKRKYRGFSLIELLLTTMILCVIMLLVATTLNTVIKVSNTTNSKNTARSNVSYIMDFVSRALSNAELLDVYMFNSRSVRGIGQGHTGSIAVVPTGNVSSAYSDGELGDTDLSDYNEIHIKLYGYDEWVCIGHFRDAKGYGYLVRTVYEEDMGGDHSLCFGESSMVTPMHSFMIDVPTFNLDYLVVGDGSNRMFVIDATLRPLYWPMKNTSLVTQDVSRQSVVSTEALTWY